MKKLLLIIITIGFISCKNEVKDRKFFIEEFNWTIVVPEGFAYMSPKEIKELRGRGMDLLENTYGDGVEDRTINLFFIEKGKLNKFEANYQPYNEATDGDYSESNEEIKNLLVNAFTQNFDDLEIDTISSIEKIDNLQFYRFEMKVTYPNKMVLKSYMFNHLFEEKDFTCSIIFTDDKIGEQMLTSFRKSKFN